MHLNPMCPSCGRVMTFVRVDGPQSADDHVFKCHVCSLISMTKDHENISGLPTIK